MRPVHGTQRASDRTWWSVVSCQPTILLIDPYHQAANGETPRALE
jgi:hypothetical protein